MKLCNNLMRKIAAFVLICGVVLLAGAPPVSAANVNIPDASLRRYINSALGANRAANAAVTEAEMKTLTSLNAYPSDLTGLEKATNLTRLSLRGSFTDISAVRGLTNLTSLGLDGSFTDISAVRGLTNLTGLSLRGRYGGSFTDISAVRGLTNLTRLSLYYGNFTDISALRGLTKLTTLGLSVNSGLDMTPLSGLTKLTTLRLEGGSLPNMTPLSGLTKLTTVGFNSGAPSDLSPLSSLTQLTTVEFGAAVSNVSPLSSLTQLRTLKIPRGYYMPSGLSSLTQLTTLDLEYLNISDISALRGLTNLTTLNLSNNVITDISALSGLTNLTWLDLSAQRSSGFNGDVTRSCQATGEWTGSAPSFRTPGITDISALRGLTKLTRLGLEGNSITDISALSGMTKLTHLSLGATRRITAVIDGTTFGMTAYYSRSGKESYYSRLSRLEGQVVDCGPLRDVLDHNPLNYPSIYTHIPALKARGVTVSFTNRVPSTLTKVSGDAQTGATGTALANPFVVEVKDSTTRSVYRGEEVERPAEGDAESLFAGVPVTFTVTAGGGTLSATSVATDATGRAQVTLTPGATAVTQTVTATVTHAGKTLTQTFTAVNNNRSATFTSAATFSVAENTTAVGTVVSTDADSQDRVTGYTLSGTDSAKFAITNAGVLTFIAAPDYDAPGDLVSTTPANAAGNNEYVIVVTATSGTGARIQTATQPLTITVTNVNELPGKPAAPTVTAVTATPTRLNVSWTAPTNTGPAITAYNLQYRKNNEVNWTAATYAGTETSTTLTGLTSGTSYDVQVMAKNTDGDGPWSNSGSATTAANVVPTFTSANTFSVAENATAVGTVVATDEDSTDSITGYEITGGADSAKFAITNAGVLTFTAAPDYDAPGDVLSATPANAAGNNEYVIVVTATSGIAPRTQTATQVITITVTNVNEPPAKPAAPTVTAVAATPTRLDVSWTAPENTGPAITDYDVQYRAGTTGAFTDANYDGTTTNTTLTGLTVGTTYHVQVRARNTEGIGPWSDSGSAATATDAAPTFTSSETFSVVENTTAVGTVIATDANSGDSVTGYEITGGADSAKFAITNAGVLTFIAAPNYDSPGDLVSTTPVNAAENNEYVIVVTATSGSGARELTATQTLTITVTDVNEPPGKPAAPTVTAAAATPTQLSVRWSEPTNTGPAINDYDVRYLADVTSIGDFIDAHYDGTADSTTLTGLKASTSYQVQVRAISPEGKGPWSDAGTAKTAVQPEDIDSDGDVDMNDLVSVVNNFGSTAPGRNDVDDDDDVDKDDIHAVFNAMLAAEAAGAPSHVTRTAQTLHHYVQQAKQDAMLDANVYRGLAVLEELIEPFLMPDETALLRNYPNPFNPETWFPYQLSRAADVTIAIYSVNGTLVRTLSLGHQAAGMYRSKSRAAYWDGRNAFGEPVASGIYFYTLTAGTFSATGKMLIRK